MRVSFDGLEEEEAEQTPCYEEHDIADKGTERELSYNDQAKAHKFIASVGKELEERWRRSIIRHIQEVIAPFEDQGLEDPEEH